MPQSPSRLSRRQTLKLVGGAVGGTVGASGLAAGGSDVVRANIGYDGSLGRNAALAAADEVVYEFSFDALTVEAPLSALTELRSAHGVRYVERDSEMEALEQTLPWGVDRVDAEATHDGDSGSGADIAIIDTGIDPNHGDLADNLGEGAAFLAGVQHPSWRDDNGHGTHCAGIAAAADDGRGVVGVAPAATLHAVKVMTAAGAGLTSDIARGIEWTADQGYDVGSLSLGASERSELVADAVTHANDEGVLIVAAAGNSGPCEDCVSYPAAYDESVAVSATTKQDGFASFSSQGDEVDIAAPGKSIYSTFLGGSYATLSGTSMACPHVSGAAGLLMADGYSNSEARQRLLDTAEDIGLSGNRQGEGLLDAAAAVGANSGDDL